MNKRPYYHIHIDGKSESNALYRDYAIHKLDFHEAPFERIDRHVPVMHLTKKYSEANYEKAKVDFELLKEAAELYDYKGYLEFEKIERRHTFLNEDSLDPLVPLTPFPLKCTNRFLATEKGEYFKAGDIHFTIPANSNPKVIQDLTEKGFLVVYPKYSNNVVFTAQFRDYPGHNENMIEMENLFLRYVKDNSSLIGKAIIKFENIIKFYVRKAEFEDLPIVLERCTQCSLFGIC